MQIKEEWGMFFILKTSCTTVTRQRFRIPFKNLKFTKSNVSACIGIWARSLDSIVPNYGKNSVAFFSTPSPPIP